MTEPYGKFLSFIILIIVAVLAPLFLMSFKMETTLENYVNSRTNEFIEECQATGRIDPVNYRSFYDDIMSRGTYDVDIIYSSLQSYPDSTNGYRDAYIAYSQQEILEVMYGGASEEALQMKNGDKLTVTVDGYAIAHVNGFMIWLTGQDADKTIARYSVTIGHTGED